MVFNGEIYNHTLETKGFAVPLSTWVMPDVTRRLEMFCQVLPVDYREFFRLTGYQTVLDAVYRTFSITYNLEASYTRYYAPSCAPGSV
jgi:hypothetical protein